MPKHTSYNTPPPLNQLFYEDCVMLTSASCSHLQSIPLPHVMYFQPSASLTNLCFSLLKKMFSHDLRTNLILFWNKYTSITYILCTTIILLLRTCLPHTNLEKLFATNVCYAQSLSDSSERHHKLIFLSATSVSMSICAHKIFVNRLMIIFYKFSHKSHNLVK